MALYDYVAGGFGYIASWYNWFVGPCPAKDFVCEYTGGNHKLPEWILHTANKLADHTGISPSITVPATAVAAVVGAAYAGKVLHQRHVQDNKAVIEGVLRKIFGPLANRLYAPFEKAIQDATNHHLNKTNEVAPLPIDTTHAKRAREARKIAIKELRRKL